MYSFSMRPTAIAQIEGGNYAPELYGEVKFYQKRESVFVVAKIFNLPSTASGFFAFHIHEGDNCLGSGFPNTRNHYNPFETMHPEHAGDLPPLMRCNGNAYLAVETDRFLVDEIIGRTIVIHSGADDFTSQPGGNAGVKIACGQIRKR